MKLITKIVKKNVLTKGKYSQEILDVQYKDGSYHLYSYKDEDFLGRFPNYILVEPKDKHGNVLIDPMAERLWDDEIGHYWSFSCKSEIEKNLHEKAAAKLLADEKAASKKEAVNAFILSESERIDKIVSDYNSLIQINEDDLTQAWSRLEMKSYKDPSKPYINDWVVMYKSVSIYGNIVPVVDTETIFKK